MNFKSNIPTITSPNLGMSNFSTGMLLVNSLAINFAIKKIISICLRKASKLLSLNSKKTISHYQLQILYII